MQSATSTTWVGRVRDDEGRVHSVRCVNDGEVPGPDAEIEAIDDPFADPGGDPWVNAREATPRVDGPRGRLDRFALEVPVRASKVIGVGRNFRAHAAELGNEVPTEPLLFFKPPSCLTPSGAAVAIPRGYERIDLEGEVVVVIGRRATKVERARAWEHVAGYVLGDDISCRDLQKRDKQWTRAKGFDGFGPIGAFVRLTPPGFELPASSLRVQSYLGDRRCQDAPLDAMIFDVPALLEYISACMTLYPGDLIFTGTPEGVSPLAPGDVARIAAEGPLALAPVITPIV